MHQLAQLVFLSHCITVCNTLHYVQLAIQTTNNFKPNDSAIKCSAKGAIQVFHLVGRLWLPIKSAKRPCKCKPICPKTNECKEAICKSHKKRSLNIQLQPGLHSVSACYSAHLPTIIGPVLPVPPRRLRGRASALGPMEDGHRTTARPPRRWRDLRIGAMWCGLKWSGP